MVENLTPQPGEEAPVEGAPAEGTPADQPVDGAPPVKDGAPVDAPQQADKDGKADEPQTGAPETYADFDLPEDVKVDEGLMEAFKPLAKDLNLSQEQAQSLINLQAKQMKGIAEAQQAAWDSTVETWTESARGDQEIGGAEFDAKLATARKAVDQFGTKELLEAFDATGVGNHPEVIRVFYRIGKLMEDENFFFGKAGTPEQSTAALIFNNSPELVK